jgi:hypothetical protein
MSLVDVVRLGHELDSRGVHIEVGEFLDILADVVASTEALTSAEQDFLVSQGGVSAEAVDPDRLATARVAIVAAATQADADALGNGYTTSEVARLFGLKTANVRRDVASRSLYVAGRTRNREHVFPRWQFGDAGPLPGLREVLAKLPEDYHPLDVASFMTTAHTELGGRTPAEWLSSGGAPAVVAGLADELGYQ